MLMLATVGTGIQDFEEIHKKNNFYVDKTLFIKGWWETNNKPRKEKIFVHLKS